MKNKILLSVIAIFALFIINISLSEVQGANVYEDDNLAISLPDSYERIKFEQDLFGTLIKYNKNIEENRVEVYFSYDSEKYDLENKEYDYSDVIEFATSLDNEDFEKDFFSIKYDIIDKDLIYIDGIATIWLKYMATENKGSNQSYEYSEVFILRTDKLDYQCEIKYLNGDLSYFDSQEYKNIINSIVIKDTVKKSRITPFKDVQTSAWYYNAVKYNWQNNIVNGINSYTFAPSNKVTRGMVATMLYSMAGAPSVTGTCKFTDVSSSKYYYNAILWASQNNILKGYTGTTKFGPNDYVTREQLAVMLTSFATYKNKYKAATSASLSSFSDASKVSSWAQNAVKWAVQNKIINGSNGKINPKGNATRAEVATMIYSYYLNIK